VPAISFDLSVSISIFGFVVIDGLLASYMYLIATLLLLFDTIRYLDLDHRRRICLIFASSLEVSR